ncbi:hypothetical protein CP8484711_1846B, partial [Chlamydia psittaci 84-8471/1]
MSTTINQKEPCLHLVYPKDI